MLNSNPKSWLFTTFGAAEYLQLLNRVAALEQAAKVLIDVAIKQQAELTKLVKPTVKFPPRLN